MEAADENELLRENIRFGTLPSVKDEAGNRFDGKHGFSTSLKGLGFGPVPDAMEKACTIELERVPGDLRLPGVLRGCPTASRTGFGRIGMREDGLKQRTNAAWLLGYRLLSGYTLKQGESSGEERSDTPVEPRGVVGKTLKHGLASKCTRGALNR
jgi:hypothetical protein